ncbi:MAG TPA: flagellar export chaperone FliS [Tepidisphaeraceae bacterium]|jgi:flagellar protein FliS|nr:flagellar export chaperone FliS [Tepidisphaeraceae bacterium]
MTAQAANQYLRTKVLTATPEQLQMMLFDGGLRFCEQARAALVAKNFEQSYDLISRVQKILLELSCSLKHDVLPDLCGKLAALYNYAYRKLIEANVRHDLASLDQAINILKYQRETWAMLLNQLGKQKAAAVARNLDVPEPNAKMEASISLRG